MTSPAITPNQRVVALGIPVLVLDDSAVAREVLSWALIREGFVVSTASTAQIAFEKIRANRPAVIVLDLQLPEMSGLEFLEKLMDEDPLPVVVCSSIAKPGAQVALRALALGAVDVIPKPDVRVREFLEDEGDSIADVVRAAAGARVRRRVATGLTATTRILTPKRVLAVSDGADAPRDAAIVIGASTGGTEAIRSVLTRLGGSVPGIVIVQHMPGTFTGAFAQHLDALGELNVIEARNGDLVIPGRALIAPGGRHIELRESPEGFRVRISDGPTVSGHRPSVDVLFQSAARLLGPRAIGILLTGMGADGAEGMVALRAQGAHTIAQDEQSSVVFGMPREAIVRGGATEVVSLSRMAPAITRALHDLFQLSPSSDSGGD